MFLSSFCKSCKELVINKFKGYFLCRGYEGRGDDNVKFQVRIEEPSQVQWERP